MNLLFYISFVAIFLTEYLDHTGNVGIHVTAIIGGGRAPILEFPYTAMVEAQFEHTTERKSCSGCVISNKKFLTAAQCVQDSVDVTVYCSLDRLSNLFGGCRRDIRENHIIIHPNFNETTLENDLALLLVDDRCDIGKLIFGDTLKGIDIFKYFSDLKEGRRFTVTGFGGIEFTEDPKQEELSEHLQYIHFPLVNQSKCKEEYAGRNKKLKLDLMFCAGFYDNTKRISFGDIGGPVVDIKSNKLVGIVSFSLPGLPAVITKVSEFRQWIIDTIDTLEEQRKRKMIRELDSEIKKSRTYPSGQSSFDEIMDPPHLV